ncbi:MAG: metallophosphoesterase [Thermoplasmata archaeon]|nr:metallophosphoesterase [Thermoplasmata archaeon]
MSRVLAIGDIHEPVSRRGYLQFCKDLYKKWKCDTVVFIGDVVDWTAISFHAHNPEAPGPKDEYKLALAGTRRWRRAFPNAIVCIGNHDARPQRVAESVSIPSKFIRNYADLWETPEWKWVQSVIIDKVYYCHGHGKGGGKTPAWNLSQKMGMSIVMGHCHSRGGVEWSANPLRRWFGMDTGCGIDDKAYAFAYAKEQVTRSVLSAGIILNGTPYHEVMPCGRGEKYHDTNFKTRRK